MILGILALMLMPMVYAGDHGDRYLAERYIKDMAWIEHKMMHNAWEDYIDNLPSHNLRPDLADMRYDDGRQYCFVIINEAQVRTLASSKPCKEARVDQGIHTCA